MAYHSFKISWITSYRTIKKLQDTPASKMHHKKNMFVFKNQTQITLIDTEIAEDRIPDTRNSTKNNEKGDNQPFLLKREVGQNVLSFPLFQRLLWTKASLRNPETWCLRCRLCCLCCRCWPTFSKFRPQKVKLRWSKRSSRHESQDPSCSAPRYAPKYFKHKLLFGRPQMCKRGF